MLVLQGESVQRLTYQYGHEEEFSRNGVGIGNGHAYMVREISDFLLTLESQAVHLVHYRWSIRYPPVTPEYLYQFLLHKLQAGREAEFPDVEHLFGMPRPGPEAFISRFYYDLKVQDNVISSNWPTTNTFEVLLDVTRKHIERLEVEVIDIDDIPMVEQDIEYLKFLRDALREEVEARQHRRIPPGEPPFDVSYLKTRYNVAPPGWSVEGVMTPWWEAKDVTWDRSYANASGLRVPTGRVAFHYMDQTYDYRPVVRFETQSEHAKRMGLPPPVPPPTPVNMNVGQVVTDPVTGHFRIVDADVREGV